MSDPSETNDTLAKEIERRRTAEARVQRLQAEVEHYRNQLRLRDDEVRYQLGDAIVRAARPSVDTLKLPARLVRLALRGIQRRRTRQKQRCPLPGIPNRALQSSQIDVSDTPSLRNLLTVPFSPTPPAWQCRPNLRIALVADEFSWRAWQFEADVCTFAPNNWQSTLAEFRPNMLLVESTWAGLHGAWRDQIATDRKGSVPARRILADIVAWCRQRDIPTAFYNKEDPPNFSIFLEAARLFDTVFTSDGACIADYRESLGHDRIHALPFAAQPRIHNPIRCAPPAENVCFAGTWYASRHHDRHDEAYKILHPALEFGLHIFDRMADTNDPEYQWPEVFRGAVRGALSYADMLDAYKQYRVFLNVNIVRNSPTMFSRRVFELLACGTPVISSFSEGIAELLGDDVVLMSGDEATTRHLLTRLLEDESYRRRLMLLGQRRVFARHTYSHRLDTVLDAVGLSPVSAVQPAITMVAVVDTPTEAIAAFEHYARQSYAHKRLALCTTRPEVFESIAGISDDPHVRQISRHDAPVAGLMAEALDACDDGWAAACNPADYYGPHYLADYAYVTQYTPTGAFGKAACSRITTEASIETRQPIEYQLIDAVEPWTLCIPRGRAIDLAQSLDDVDTPRAWWMHINSTSPRIYAADAFNYAQSDIGAPPPDSLSPQCIATINA